MSPRVLLRTLIPIVIGISLLPIQGMARQEPTSGGSCRQNSAGIRHYRSSDEPIVASIKQLKEKPEDYYGETVTVDGELHRTFADNVFTIEDSSFYRSQEILVISTVPKAEAVVRLEGSLKEGKTVRVTGVVLPYNRSKLECAYGPLHLDGREGDSFTKNPVLVIADHDTAANVFRARPMIDRTEFARSSIPYGFSKSR